MLKCSLTSLVRCDMAEIVMRNLASDESQFVNGTVIDVDGGRVGVAVIAAG